MVDKISKRELEILARVVRDFDESRNFATVAESSLYKKISDCLDIGGKLYITQQEGNILWWAFNDYVSYEADWSDFSALYEKIFYGKEDGEYT